MKQRSTRPRRTVAIDLVDIPITIVGVTPKSLRLDSRDFHDPLVRDLMKLGLLAPVDPRRGGRAYMERLHVNYLRHNGVNLGGPGYRQLLEHGTQRLGFHAAYHDVNRRILDAIAARIPHLAAACAGQQGEEYLVEPEDIFRPYFRSHPDGLLPLSIHGDSTVEARMEQRVEEAMRRVPTMTDMELARFAVTYHKDLQRAHVLDAAEDATGDQIAKMKVRYLRDRALGLDRRNVNQDRYQLGADRDEERTVLLAIARKYPDLNGECEHQIQRLDRAD